MKSILAVGLAVIGIGLTACSSGASDVTCDEWATASDGERDQYEQDVLESHDLDIYAVGNGIGLFTALLEFCGDPISAPETGRATRNGSELIDDAVDWDAVESSGRWP